MQKVENLITVMEDAPSIEGIIGNNLSRNRSLTGIKAELELATNLSAADFYLKNKESRDDDQAISGLRNLMSEYGYLPQHGTSRVPTLCPGWINVSPNGALCVNIASSKQFIGYVYTIIANRIMKPIATIPGVEGQKVVGTSFSDDSKYLAIVADKGLQIWNTNHLQMAIMDSWAKSQPTYWAWSRDSSRFVLMRYDTLSEYNMETDEVRTLSRRNSESDRIGLDEDGSHTLICGPFDLELYEDGSLKNKQKHHFSDYEYCIDVTYSDCKFRVMTNRALYICDEDLNLTQVCAFPNEVGGIRDRLAICSDPGWYYSGTSSDGKINFIEIDSKYSFYKALTLSDVRFARIKAPEHQFEVFEGSVIPNEMHVSTATMILRGSDVSYVHTKIEDGMSVQSINHGKISKGQLKVNRFLKPDISRLNARVFPIDGDRYAISFSVDNGEDSDRKTKRPLRLMSVETGTRVTSDKADAEGLMVMDDWSPSSNGSACLIHSHEFLVAECGGTMDCMIKSWNVYTGRGYGLVQGRILDSDEENVLIGRCSDTTITEAAWFDYRLKRVTPWQNTDVDMMAIHSITYPNRKVLRTNGTDGNEIMEMAIPKNYLLKREQSALEPMPVIMPLGACTTMQAAEDDAEIDNNNVRAYRPVYQRCRISTLRFGMLSNSAEVEIPLRVRGSLKIEDVLDALSCTVSVYIVGDDYCLFREPFADSQNDSLFGVADMVKSGEHFSEIYYAPSQQHAENTISVQGNLFSYIEFNIRHITHRMSDGSVQREIDTKDMSGGVLRPLYLDDRMSIVDSGGFTLINTDRGIMKVEGTSDELCIRWHDGDRYVFEMISEDRISKQSLEVDIGDMTASIREESYGKAIVSHPMVGSDLLEINGVFVSRRLITNSKERGEESSHPTD